MTLRLQRLRAPTLDSVQVRLSLNRRIRRAEPVAAAAATDHDWHPSTSTDSESLVTESNLKFSDNSESESEFLARTALA